jgi:hypothetical protein
MFRRGSPFVRQFNQIITEQISFISSRLIDREQLFKKICSDHLFPQDADVSAIFAPLHTKAVSSNGDCSIATLKDIDCFQSPPMICRFLVSGVQTLFETTNSIIKPCVEHHSSGQACLAYGWFYYRWRYFRSYANLPMQNMPVRVNALSILIWSIFTGYPKGLFLVVWHPTNVNYTLLHSPKHPITLFFSRQRTDECKTARDRNKDVYNTNSSSANNRTKLEFGTTCFMCFFV